MKLLIGLFVVVFILQTILAAPVDQKALQGTSNNLNQHLQEGIIDNAASSTDLRVRRGAKRRQNGGEKRRKNNKKGRKGKKQQDGGKKARKNGRNHN